MITEGWHAWILRRRAVGETSAQVTFFTREVGMVSALYQGARTAKKQAMTQAFMPLWVSVNRRGERFFVREVECLGPSIPLSGDALFSGYYLNELVFYTIRSFESYTVLFEQYAETLALLSAAKNRQELEKFLRYFEYHLLQTCGYQVTLTLDLSGQPILANQWYHYLAGEGFVLSAGGVFSGADVIAFSEGRFDAPRVLSTAKRIMRIAIDHALDGRPIKAREFYTHWT